MTGIRCQHNLYIDFLAVLILIRPAGATVILDVAGPADIVAVLVYPYNRILELRQHLRIWLV